jgi:undecaprenyl-diphosphatase
MNSSLLTGGVVLALFSAAWVTAGNTRRETHEIFLFGLFGSGFSVFLARVLALTLPFRARPIHNPTLNFQLPYGMDRAHLINWSSYPSDHATLFFCLAAILWMASSRLGMVAMAYTLLVISLPRVYTGVHYPTDILAGGLLGCGVASLAYLPRIRSAVTRPAIWCAEAYPVIFYCCLFLYAFEVAELFSTTRDLAFPVFIFHKLL